MGKHTAVLAAVVAAVSLAISAWGTWKAAQVSDDQLAQSQAQSLEENRAQASLISFWHTHEGGLVVANRSFDPASALVSGEGARAVKWIGVIPPCSRVSMPQDLTDTLFDPWPSGEPKAATRLNIIDANGFFWQRNDFGYLGRYSRPTDSWEFDDLDYMARGETALLERPEVKVTDLEPCGTR
ncbi:hypothetical protein [Streptomyces sp. NPDC002685]|uniref:hypothetical protein n=1 Tax=Streptomyces sp. NPDC002685 TaxID=3154540 RepID=UPI0033196548